MSESEYSVGNDQSDDDYAMEEKPKQRLRRGNRNTNYQMMHEEPQPQVEKKQTRAKRSRYQTQTQNKQTVGSKRPFNYAEEYADQPEEDPHHEEQDAYSIFNIEISQIIWRRQRESTKEPQYLIKMKGRSFMHCEWMTEEEIEALGQPVKNKLNRFNKAHNIKLAEGNFDEDAIDEGKFFEQTYLEVDRILAATEMFPVIHQKKANEIKGKWTESLMIVCSKLLNFTKNFVNYGVLFCEPVDTEREGCEDYLKVITHPMDLGTILNRIFLDIYKNANDFWRDVGLVFRNCLKYNSEPSSDLHILGLTLRECAIFLYDQWYHLSEQRYKRLKEELEPVFEKEAKENQRRLEEKAQLLRAEQERLQREKAEKLRIQRQRAQEQLKAEQQKAQKQKLEEQRVQEQIGAQAQNVEPQRIEEEKQQQEVEESQDAKVQPQNEQQEGELQAKAPEAVVADNNQKMDEENNQEQKSQKPIEVEPNNQAGENQQNEVKDEQKQEENEISNSNKNQSALSQNIENLKVTEEKIDEETPKKQQNEEEQGEVKSENKSDKGFSSGGEQVRQNLLEVEAEANSSDDQSSSPQKAKSAQLEEQEDRQYLDMEEFYKKNIFLSEKKVEDPTTREQLQLLNPGEFNYRWLCEDPSQAQKFVSYNYEEIDFQDMKKLDLNVEVDHLYMVKWKNLSYSEATWQLQSAIGNVDKINEFKMVNKALGREARTSMDSQREKHRIMVELELNPKKRSRYSNFQMNEIRNKLYFYDVGNKKHPPQYKIENQPVYKNYKLLRPYQLESVNWLIKSWYEKRNTILADEMGLGKTIQSIAFLYHLHSVQNVKGPFLVIAPLSTLEHWKRTVEEWTNMNCVLYYDQNGQSGRRSIQYYEWNHTNITMKGNAVPSELNKFQILITSYEVFLSDFNDVIMNIPFQFVIVDEAHRLKNKNAKILSTLKRLPCKRVLLLTGTPIQNNTGELWSLLNYIHPEKFQSFEDFRRSFGDLSSHEQVEHLNRVLKPYMLRRMKQDVEQSIPPLQETIIDVEMTNLQKTIYRALFEKNKNMLSKGLSSSSSYNTNLNNLEIQLRKCCNHPFLIKEIEQDMMKEVQLLSEKAEKMITASGKMVLVEKLLEKCKKQGKKVLIFSQFTHMLQLIEDYLRYKEYKFERIDGQVKAKQRQAAIDRYNNPHKKRDVFLLSTKAGGVGINLTSANVVIIYDSDWNPQNDVQATARAHRIGQKSQVQVYRLVTCNTYETEMFERATQKLGIDKAIFMSGTFKETGEIQQNKMDSKASKGEMEMLLKKGILGFLQNEENEEAEKTDKFFNKNVDEILENNSRVAKYSMINGSCTFSKQRFVSEGADNELKLNDPNFWNIVLKNVQSQTQQLLKKMKSPQNFKTIDQQKQLMVQASQLMGSIIENKLSLTGFNADDEINLSEFFTLVNSQRQFNKYYRDLASQWLEEISKPSRRFKKFTLDDLEIPKKGQQTTQQRKLNTRSNPMGGNEDDDQNNNNIFGDEEEFEEQEDDSDENARIKFTEAKKDEYLKKLCCLCEKSKCTIFCKGYCKRAYHEECRKALDKDSTLSYDDVYTNATTLKSQPQELQMETEKLKEIMDVNFTCEDCRANVVQCLICKGKGSYYGAEYKKNKKGNKSGAVGGKNEEGMLVEDAGSKNNKKKNELTKCSTANCAKFFHPKCIEEYDTKKLFKYIDSSSLHFRCSLHYCNVCGISGQTMSVYQCVRCPKALHAKCMDKDKLVKISKKQFICETHFKNKKDFKKAQERFQPQQTLKKFMKQEKVEAKKKDKASRLAAVEGKFQGERDDEESDRGEGDEQEEVIHNYSTRRKGVNGDELSQELSKVEKKEKAVGKKSDKKVPPTQKKKGEHDVKKGSRRDK